MLGRLKDQRVGLSERLSLAGKLWETDAEVGPNKHQIIADAVVGILVNNKKRNELNEEERMSVWETLCHILQSPQTRNADRSGKGVQFTVRPALAQVLVDVLEADKSGETYSGKGSECGVLRSVLGCCSAILESSMLSYVLTTRFDILVSLTSVVCQLGVSLPVADTASLKLPHLLSQLASHLQQVSHRCQLSQSQVLHIVGDKLMLPVTRLAFHAHTHADGAVLEEAAQGLQDFVLKILFQEGHLKLFKMYLDIVTKQISTEQVDGENKKAKSPTASKETKQEESAQLPRAFSNLFSKLFASFQAQKKTKSGPDPVDVQKKAVLHFVPAFFKHAALVWRKTPQESFQLLVHLNTFLGIPVDGDKGAVDENCVRTMAALLKVVQDTGIYNVAADRVAGGTQLKYFRHVLQVLLKTSLSSDLCKCLTILLHLNHLILEGSIKQVLQHCCACLTQLSAEVRAGVDEFLAAHVSTYSQLHQMPKWFGFVLDLNAARPQQLPALFTLLRFTDRMHDSVQTLPQTTALDVWSRLLTDITSIFQNVTEENQNDATSTSEHLWSLSMLYHTLVSHARLYDSSVTSRMVDSIQTLQSDLEQKILRPAFEGILLKKKNVLLGRSCLLLALSLGDVKLMLALYRTSGASQQQFHITAADFPFCLKPHELFGKNKSLSSDAHIKLLMDALTTQKQQVLAQEEATQGDGGTDMAGYFTFQKETGTDEGNENISSIDDFQLAKLHLFTQKSALLLPSMLEKNGSKVPELIVEIFAQSGKESSSEAARCTSQSLALYLLHESGLGNSREFYQQLVCCLWQRFAHGASASPKKKKKSSGLATFQSLFQVLGETGVDWTDLSNRQVQDAADAVNSMLADTGRQQTELSTQCRNLLQLFHHLPLTYLPPGSKLQCILGLITLLVHQERSSFSQGPVNTTLANSKKSTVDSKLLDDFETFNPSAAFTQLRGGRDAPSTQLCKGHGGVKSIDSKQDVDAGKISSKTITRNGVLESLTFLDKKNVSESQDEESAMNKEQDKMKDEDSVLKTAERDGDSLKTGDRICRLLTELLDAAVGTSAFECVKPHLLLSKLEEMCVECCAEEKSPLGQLLKKAVTKVVMDFSAVLGLEPCIIELEKRLQKVVRHIQTKGPVQLDTYEKLLTVTQYVLQELHWYLKKDFYRQDVQTATRTYFSKISTTLDSIVDTLQQVNSDLEITSFPPPLISCYEEVIVQRCTDTSVEDERAQLEGEHLSRVEVVLSQIVSSLSKITGTPSSAEVSFLSRVYQHQEQLSMLLTADRTRTMWNTICAVLLKNAVVKHSSDRFPNKLGARSSGADISGQDFTDSDGISGTGDSAVNPFSPTVPSTESGGHSRTKGVKQEKNGGEISPASKKLKGKRKRNPDTENDDSASVTPVKKSKGERDTDVTSRTGVQRGECSQLTEEEEEKLREALVVILCGCDVSLFSDLMEGIIRDVCVESLTRPVVVEQAVLVLQKVIGCNNLTREKRNILEDLSIKYLLQCVAVMRDISCFYPGLSCRVGVPILNSLTEMLTLERFLSAKGTIQSLMCCSLISLGGGDSSHFLPAFQAVYNVLHAVLVHHPHTAVNVIQDVLVIAASLLRECIRNGDQARLLSQPALVDPMVRCANLVSRLLALLATHQTELHRVAVGIISEYANGVKAVTLLPAVKKALLSGVYAFLDLCDKHAVTQLRTMLPPGVREVFHLLHDDYTKYYKYTGKV